MQFQCWVLTVVKNNYPQAVRLVADEEALTEQFELLASEYLPAELAKFNSSDEREMLEHLNEHQSFDVQSESGVVLTIHSVYVEQPLASV